MSSYRRILAILDFSSQAEAVARRGLQIARAHGASLGLATVIDYTPGEAGEDCYPAISPQRQRQQIEEDVSGKLQRLAERIGAAGAEVITASGSRRQAAAELAQSWRPDLVVVGAYARHGLEPGQSDTPFDLLTLQVDRPSLGGRVIRALAAAF